MFSRSTSPLLIWFLFSIVAYVIEAVREVCPITRLVSSLGMLGRPTGGSHAKLAQTGQRVSMLLGPDHDTSRFTKVQQPAGTPCFACVIGRLLESVRTDSRQGGLHEETCL